MFPMLTDRGWRGRLLVVPTVNNYIARGIRYRQTREVTELSTDIPENRSIKGMLSHLVGYFSQFPDNKSRENRSRAATLYKLFDRVSNATGDRATLARQCLLSIKRIPGDHKVYEPILWLCYLIATRQGVSVESFGPAHIIVPPVHNTSTGRSAACCRSTRPHTGPDSGR